MVPPTGGDLESLTPALSGTGALAVGYTLAPADLAPTRAGLGRRRLPAQAVLALAYLGSSPRLVLWQGAAVRVSGPSGSGRTLLSGLSGPVTAALVAVRGGGLTVVGGQDGVWASAGRRGYGRTHELDGPSQAPRALAAGPAPGGRAIVAWTDSSPARILVAGLPGGRPRVLFKAPAARQLDGVATAGSTVAWSESWYDALGAYHAVVYAATGGGRPVALSRGSLVSDAVALAAGPRGAVLAAWRSCAPGAAACAAFSAQLSGRRWSHAREAGPLDAGQAPAVAMTDTGTALVGWIEGGRVHVSGRVLPSRDADQLALVGGAQGRTLGVWSEGTARQSLQAALYR